MAASTAASATAYMAKKSSSGQAAAWRQQSRSISGIEGSGKAAYRPSKA